MSDWHEVVPITQAATSTSTSPFSSLSFTQGFLLGQLTIVLLIGAFIKFFVFGEIPSSESSRSSRLASETHLGSKRPSSKDQKSYRARSASLHGISSFASGQKSSLKKKRSVSHILRHPPRLSPEDILSKTYYNVFAHQPESLDWFNVLIAQTIAQFRNDAVDDDAILTSLTNTLNGGQKPDFLGEIKVSEINLGEEFPIFSNCRIHRLDGDDEPAAKSGEGHHSSTQTPALQARMDVDLSDFITLAIDTKLILNYPRPMTAVLPVALSVSIARFSGTLSMSFLPSSSSQPPSGTIDPPPAASLDSASSSALPSSATPTSLAFSFLPDYRLDLSVRSLIGSKSRLQDVPKVAQLVESRLHQWIDERCVEPRIQQVVLPSLWPRKKNTRGPPNADVDHEGTPRGSMNRAVGKEVAGQLREFAARGSPFRSEEKRSHERKASDLSRDLFEEGLRQRGKAYGAPGGM